MTDLAQTIAPKSDQLNADDLIAGPRTVRVTRVSASGEAEQPIAINFDGDNGKPYKPCKSMRRVLVHVWGRDGNSYAGKSMTLYRDPGVRFGGIEVGGIRISHMTGIDKDITMALTATKASRKPFTVRPLVIKDQKSKVAQWIESTLQPAIAGCETMERLAEIQQSKGYKTAVERGEDADRKTIQALVDEALKRIQPVGEGDDDLSGLDTDDAADPDAEAATDLIRQVTECADEPAVVALSKKPEVQKHMAAWKKSRSDLFDKVDEAIVAKLAEFEAAK